MALESEWMRAKDRRFEETAVFIHNFGGNRRSVVRHARLLNELGFDCVRFDLVRAQLPTSGFDIRALPITADLHWGLRGVWTDQIEGVLNSVAGRKIVYAFSMPSACAIEAIGRRNASDIASLVCDGGPFLDIARCIWNLYREQYRVDSRLMGAAFVGISMALWGLGFEDQMKKALALIPKGFPVLSIAGWRDPLVSPEAIDRFWELQDHLNVESLALPDGKHLDGLKIATTEYTFRVKDFLARTAHARAEAKANG